jgi:hypothetical protein
MKSFFVFIFILIFASASGQKKVIDLIRSYNNPIIFIKFQKGSTNNYEIFIKNFLEKQGFKTIIGYNADSAIKYDFKVIYDDYCFTNNRTRFLGIWLIESSNSQHKFFVKYRNEMGFKCGNCIKVTEKLLSKLLGVSFVKDRKRWDMDNTKLRKAVFLKVDSGSYVLAIVRKRIRVKDIEPLFLSYAHKLTDQKAVNYYYDYGDAFVKQHTVYTVGIIPVGYEEKVIKFIRIYGSVKADPFSIKDTKLKEVPVKHSRYIDKLLFGN